MAVTVGLCMIVRNEGHIIERCLASLRPLIDHWTIVDTGSTDDTREKIRSALSDLPGELHERPWRNFGHNRSEALALARPHATYTFVIDADEILLLPEGFRWPLLSQDSYRLLHQHGSLQHWRTSLVNNRLPWRYVGVLHEYIEAEGTPYGSVNLPGPVVHAVGDGGRSQGVSVAEKYARDARILEEALVEEPGNPRYQFYLAQSYRDSGQVAEAIAAYEKRAEMGGWPEEVWYSLYQAAALRIHAAAAPDAVIAAFTRAYEYRPERAEALCALAGYLRQAGRHALAYVFARRAMETPRPQDILFLEAEVYAWRALDEYAVAAYWAGDYHGSAEACRRLLGLGGAPASERTRIEQNLGFATARLSGAA
jgi:tetratricopeptide (TPR) repeat protein